MCLTLRVGIGPTGSAISWDGHFNTQIEDEVFSSVIDLVLNCAAFIYIGAWLPFDQFNRAALGITPWRLVVLTVAILTLRRIPPLLLLYKLVPEISGWREALFAGHFGRSQYSFVHFRSGIRYGHFGVRGKSIY